ncbi:MAG: TRAP transporter small permease [Bacillota bacterium]|nr:TRAP transporter small permease [Bacillota bacterium]
MLKRIADAIDRVLEPVVVAMLGAGLVSVLLQVIYRYIVSRYTDYALPWTEELARYLTIWITFLTVSMGLVKGLHVSLDIGVVVIPSKLRKWTTLLGRLLMLGFTVIVAWEGYSLARFNALQVSPALRVSMFWSYLAVPAGMLVASLRLVSLIVEDLRRPAAEFGLKKKGGASALF